MARLPLQPTQDLIVGPSGQLSAQSSAMPSSIYAAGLDIVKAWKRSGPVSWCLEN